MIVADLIAFWSSLPPGTEVHLDKNEWEDYGDTPALQLGTLFNYFDNPKYSPKPFVTINN
jgi:hypothetical protein